MGLRSYMTPRSWQLYRTLEILPGNRLYRNVVYIHKTNKDMPHCMRRHPLGTETEPVMSH